MFIQSTAVQSIPMVHTLSDTCMTLTPCPQVRYSGEQNHTQPSPFPPHSKLGCLLFPAGSSCNGISLFGGGWGGKTSFLHYNSAKFQKGSSGQSVSTNFVTKKIIWISF